MNFIDLKGVGQNLQNHYGSGIAFKVKNKDWTSIEHAFSISNVFNYVTKGTGQFASNLGEMHGIILEEGE